MALSFTVEQVGSQSAKRFREEGGTFNLSNDEYRERLGYAQNIGNNGFIVDGAIKLKFPGMHDAEIKALADGMMKLSSHFGDSIPEMTKFLMDHHKDPRIADKNFYEAVHDGTFEKFIHDVRNPSAESAVTTQDTSASKQQAAEAPADLLPGLTDEQKANLEKYLSPEEIKTFNDLVSDYGRELSLIHKPLGEIINSNRDAISSHAESLNIEIDEASLKMIEKANEQIPASGDALWVMMLATKAGVDRDVFLKNADVSEEDVTRFKQAEASFLEFSGTFMEKNKDVLTSLMEKISQATRAENQASVATSQGRTENRIVVRTAAASAQTEEATAANAQTRQSAVVTQQDITADPQYASIGSDSTIIGAMYQDSIFSDWFEKDQGTSAAEAVDAGAGLNQTAKETSFSWTGGISGAFDAVVGALPDADVAARNKLVAAHEARVDMRG